MMMLDRFRLGTTVGLVATLQSVVCQDLESSYGLRRLQNGDDESGQMVSRRLGCRQQPLEKFADDVTPEHVLSFYVMGDTPYTTFDRYCLNSQLRDLDLTQPDGPSFIMHVGDLKKSGKGYDCDAEAYNDIAEIFTNEKNALHYDPRDIMNILGDTEWQDCGKVKEEEEAGFDLWRQTFGPGNPYEIGTRSTGIRVERQTDAFRLPGKDRSENFAFFENSVLVMSVNIVGGNDYGDEELRLGQNWEWTQKQFHAHKDEMKAAVIFGHSFLKPGVRMQYYGNHLIEFLAEEFPDLPVAYIHGDGHEYCVRRIDKDRNYNFLTLMVDEGMFAPPVLVKILKDPATDKHIFDFDRRGGIYPGPGAICPITVEKTWSSPDDMTEGPPPAGPLPFYSPFPPVTEPASAPAPPPPVAADQAPPPSGIKMKLVKDTIVFGECQGDCHSDDQCEGEMKCFYRRKGKDVIPGCLGRGMKKKGFCFRKEPDTLFLWGSPPDQPFTEGQIASMKPSQVRYPLKKCEGDCDTDDHCEGELVCNANRKVPEIPGCAGTRHRKRNYCWDPNDAPDSSTQGNNAITSPPTQQPTTNPAGTPGLELTLVTGKTTFGECEGHCRSDAQCDGNMMCFFRRRFEELPGCQGQGERKKGYCFNRDPNALILWGKPGKPANRYPLEKCAGDCEEDTDCQGDLVCNKNRKVTEIPGCVGQRHPKRNYCYDVNDETG